MKNDVMKTQNQNVMQFHHKDWLNHQAGLIQNDSFLKLVRTSTANNLFVQNLETGSRWILGPFGIRDKRSWINGPSYIESAKSSPKQMQILPRILRYEDKRKKLNIQMVHYRCWWRMLETVCVGDKFHILMTEFSRGKSRQHNDSANNCLKLSRS